MKTLHSKIEGTWIELKKVQLTQEQKDLLKSKDQETINYVKSKREVAAELSDAEIAQAKYNEVKPVLTEDDTYDFIAVDLEIDEDSVSGILNFRLNCEHKQTRF
jgi:NRPS condensation-like uncharacterized protein